MFRQQPRHLCITVIVFRNPPVSFSWHSHCRRILYFPITSPSRAPSESSFRHMSHTYCPVRHPCSPDPYFRRSMSICPRLPRLGSLVTIPSICYHSTLTHLVVVSFWTEDPRDRSSGLQCQKQCELPMMSGDNSAPSLRAVVGNAGVKTVHGADCMCDSIWHYETRIPSPRVA